jgi:hypothetical protein
VNDRVDRAAFAEEAALPIEFLSSEPAEMLRNAVGEELAEDRCLTVRNGRIN